MNAQDIAKIDRQLRLLEASSDGSRRSLAPYMRDYLHTSLLNEDPSLNLRDLRNIAPGELSRFIDKQDVGGPNSDPISALLQELHKPDSQSAIEKVAEADAIAVNTPSAAEGLEAEAQALRDTKAENSLKLEESRRALGQAQIFTGRNTAEAPGQKAELDALGQDTSTLNLDPQVEASSAPITAVSNNLSDRARSNRLVAQQQRTELSDLENQAAFVRSFEQNLEQTRKTIEKALLQGLSTPRDTKEGSNPNG